MCDVWQNRNELISAKPIHMTLSEHPPSWYAASLPPAPPRTTLQGAGRADVAVLGGLMEDRIDNKSGRFPGVGDIPLVGEIFTTRNNASSKSELVILLRPTVIKDAALDGDFGAFADTLPNRDFFRTDPVYKPFSGPTPMQEPLK